MDCFSLQPKVLKLQVRRIQGVICKEGFEIRGGVLVPAEAFRIQVSGIVQIIQDEAVMIVQRKLQKMPVFPFDGH
jgi:hypothetical protein